MFYSDLCQLNSKEFKRSIGVKKEIFELMINSVQSSVDKEITNRYSKRGNKTKLEIPDQILIMLEYYREYGTMFHIAKDKEIYESTVCRIISRIENILIADKLFQLPPKRELSNLKIETIIVDATEITIQRPKKNKNN